MRKTLSKWSGSKETSIGRMLDSYCACKGGLTTVNGQHHTNGVAMVPCAKRRALTCCPVAVPLSFQVQVSWTSMSLHLGQLFRTKTDRC